MKKALKRSLSLLLAITIIFGSAYVGLSEVDFDGLFAVKAKAATSGTTGDCTWSLDGTVLTISGNGAMEDYQKGSRLPWSEKITELIIEDGVTNIGSSAFGFSTKLISITIPDSVTYIGEHAFTGCTNLKSVTIPNSVTSVDYRAFYSCTNLSSVVIGNSVTTIGSEAFQYCTNLTSLTIPNNVSSIGLDAFSGCTGLLKIYWNAKNIGDFDYSIFSNSGSESAGTTIAFSDTVEKIPSNSFNNFTNLISINVDDNNSYYTSIDGVLFNNNKTTLIKYPNGKNNNEYIIPNSVLTIAGGAFDRCRNLTIITIPDKVSEIEEGAFSGCTSLEKLYWNAKNTNVFSGFESVFVDVGSAETGFDVVFGDTVEKIPPELFDGCVNLTSVTIGNSVTTIGDSAFSGCTNLTSITISNNIKYIGTAAFYDCKSLTTVICTDCNFDFTFNEFSSKEIGAYNDNFLNAEWIYADHTPGNWIIDIQATTTATGLKHKKCTECGQTVETATIPQLKPATPKVSSTNALNGVQLNWNKVAGAVKYNIYRRQGGQSSFTYIGTTTGATFTDKNVKSGTYYVYSVRAYNSEGGYSAYISGNTSTRKYMATPKLTTIYNHQNGLAIKWNAVAGVTKGYRVYRRGAGSTYWTYLGTTKNLYFIDSQVKNKSGEYFRYTVIADGDYHSKFDTTGLYLRRLANPTLNSAVSSKSGITVKWGKVAGSSGYYVYRKTANSTWTRIAVVKGVNGLSYLDKTAKKGTTYTYTVRAVYGNTLSSYYSGISCKDKY